MLRPLISSLSNAYGNLARLVFGYGEIYDMPLDDRLE